MSTREREIMSPAGGRCRVARALAVGLLLVVAGCGDGPTLDRLGDDAVILAFGDSLTHGTGADPDESYPAVLERRIGRKVVNAGEPGELSAEGLRRLPRVLDRVQPDLLILCHGGNDILRNGKPARAAENLLAMVGMARDRGIEVLLVGVPERTLMFHDTADLYHDVAEQAGVPLEDGAIADIVGDNALKSDAVHPNAAGYRKLAIAIEERLREAGAL
ncbi:MAG: arylesterase [Halofilum sp. (in: g-proteobacteria)]|nr:arylesterase [Halofilum sp. (in: g-proteobacteria)]